MCWKCTKCVQNFTTLVDNRLLSKADGYLHRTQGHPVGRGLLAPPFAPRPQDGGGERVSGGGGDQYLEPEAGDGAGDGAGFKMAMARDR